MTKQPTPIERASDQYPLDAIEASRLNAWVLNTYTRSPLTEAFYNQTPESAQQILAELQITLSVDDILKIIKRP